MIAYAVVGALAALVGLAAAFHVVFGAEQPQVARAVDETALEVSWGAIEAGVELAVDVTAEFGLELLASLAG